MARIESVRVAEKLNGHVEAPVAVTQNTLTHEVRCRCHGDGNWSNWEAVTAARADYCSRLDHYQVRRLVSAQRGAVDSKLTRRAVAMSALEPLVSSNNPFNGERTMIDIKGKNKAEVLAKLYNASRQLGMGVLHANGEDMTTGEAQAILDSGQTYFDYLNGRVMKVDLSGDELNPRLYDRDNGHGAAAAALGG